MKIEVLHVQNCPNVALLTARLEEALAGRRDVVIDQRAIRDEAEAATRRMTGSPTLLVDGTDPFAIAGQAPSMSCRLYRDVTGAVGSAPSLAQLRALLAPGGR